MLPKRIRRHAHLLVPVHDVRRHNQLHHTSKAFSRFPWYSAFICCVLPIPMLTPRLQARIQCCQRRLQELQEARNHFADRLIHHLTFRSDQVRYTKAYRVYIPKNPPCPSTSTSLASLLHWFCAKEAILACWHTSGQESPCQADWTYSLTACNMFTWTAIKKREHGTTWNNMKLSSLVHLAITDNLATSCVKIMVWIIIWW